MMGNPMVSGISAIYSGDPAPRRARPRDRSRPVPTVRGRLACQGCGQVVVTGPEAETEAWAAFELGSSRRTHDNGAEHFRTCKTARLVLSFYSVGRN